MDLQWFDAAAITRLLPMREAVDAVEAALLAGLDPAADPPRDVVDLVNGQVLLMPSEAGGRVGVKVATVTPANPARGLPRVQATYLLLDALTHAPLALFDGLAVTSLRTPAVSAVAARHLARPDASRLVVFGTGPQATGHVEALRAVRPITDVRVVGRDPDRTRAFAEAAGATVGTPDDVTEADVVVCATTATTPLFTGSLVSGGCCVIAVGSHEPHVREVDSALMGRATVVVEDRATALREAGDVILAMRDGAVTEFASLADLVNGRVPLDPRRPRVYKSVGMAWQDLAVAAEVHRRA
jgi:ornithine cyclodeaminase/alanine dehydrogenase-like protein (mu-crystallin family)